MGSSFGVAAAATTVLLLAGAAWYASRPRAWDRSAVTATALPATQRFTLGNQTPPEFKQAGFVLRYALQNNTNRDITLPTSVAVMQRLSEGSALDALPGAAIEEAVFIPADEAARLEILVDWSCDIGVDGTLQARRPGECFDDLVEAMDGMVLFYENDRIQVELPKPQLPASFR